MKKSVFLMTALMVVLTIGAYGQNGKKFFKAGNEFVDNLKYEDAIVQFTSAIGLEPSNAEYYSARGNAYEMAKKYNEAYADYSKAMVFKPKEVTTIVALGRVCNNLGKYEEALVLLNKASGMAVRNPQVYPEKAKTLISLGKFDMGLKVADSANIIKEDAMNFYYRAKCYINLNNDILAAKELDKAISKDKKLVEPRLELAELLIRAGKTVEATSQINSVLAIDDKNAQAYIARSKVFKKNLDYPSAINDVSKTILIDPANPEYYKIRGIYYQEFNQHSNAINDFSKYISLNPKDPDGYFARAKSYEEILNPEKAIEDYNKITVISEFDMKARKMLKEAQLRLYKLNEEKVAPEINVISPSIKDNVIAIKGNSNSVTISGLIKEKSKLDTLVINGQRVLFGDKKNGENEFITSVDVTGKDAINILARDEYNNINTLELKLVRTETDKPVIKIVAPVASADGQLMLDEIKPFLGITGKIEDASQIKSIEVGGILASFDPKQLNPVFTASIEISNINKVTVAVEDIYGNRQETEYPINRDNAMLLMNNPMGKTWVVFIENSSYEFFASLDGPIKDVSTIQRALSNYQISRVIHKKDMTKQDMERFFNIELRDELKANFVKSLLIWYAGHGKSINDIGYWIPVDAKRDDEFTYFSIMGLKSGMQSYAGLTHTLVISDACESGPSFYQAMRSVNEEPTCDNVQKTAMKSAQVFSSAGYELAVDNSQFTQTFANTLINNKHACVPIETVVKSVTAAVANSNQNKPKFGLISGLEDQGGSFFFIAK
jgi:tetratricopeptide (TPR) repeat protein